MKRLFTLLLGLVAVTTCFSCPSVVSQNGWRWRNDDGNETTATWKAAQNNPVSYPLNNDVVRLRVQLVNGTQTRNSNGQCVALSLNPRDSLQYSINTSNTSSWKNVGTDATAAFTLAGVNTFMAQNDTTSSQITGSASAFSPGKIMVTDSVFKGITVRASGRTEVEWAIKGTANLIPNSTYYFRHRGATNSYSSYPSLTTGSPPPVQLVRFAVMAEDKRAKLQWETASEPYNDRFEVQRSIDQRTWQTLTTVKGTGNATAGASYTAYDANPMVGNNYYRLQQFDRSGKSNLLDTQLLKIGGSTTGFTVYPNPAQGVVRFVNTEAAVDNVTATVSTISGKIIYRQSFGSLPAGSINRLNMTAPLPGIYLLQFKSSTTAETIKLIIR